ncbi:MAG: hypothetical protein DMF73_20065, partial [Acidobacteria bacterium]
DIMATEHLQQVQDLFHAVLEREPRDRSFFLDEACSGNKSLLQEVESLIVAHEEEEHFIDSPAYVATAEMLTDGQEFKPGQTLSHYEICSVLGEGGMGKVYLAEDKKLKRKVALKVLPTANSGDEEARRRLLREAQAAAALDHPNICAIYEVDEESDRSYIAMQYIEGETLEARISRLRFSLDDSLNVAVQVADALAEAHAHNIIHRDIKPANIMLTGRGQVKVLDFGLAKTASTNLVGPDEAETRRVLTVPGMILGTVPYMSPEQLRGASVDVRSDIFSFGVVLYEMLSGRQAFARDSDAETIGAILHQQPDAEGRYQTMEQVARELNAAREGEFATGVPKEIASGSPRMTASTHVVKARPTSSAEYMVGEITRHRLSVSFALAAVVLIATTIAYFSYFANRAGGDAIDSVAVLPFVNVDNDPNKDYLSEGISDSIINNLTQLPSLRVMSLNSVLRYKGKQAEAQAVGRELQVGAVLIGSFTQHGDDLSISTELVDVRDNHRLWGDQYNRKRSDIIAVQSEIAQQISEKLRLRLTGAQQQQVAKHYTENTKAYELYILGNYYVRGKGKEGFDKSIDFFEQAIKIDQNYALAYAGLSRAYYSLGMRGFWLPKESRQKTEWAALKAVELDDSLAEAHASLGLVKEALSWDWTGAEKEFRRALELNPNSAFVLGLYGTFLVHDGRPEEAIPYMKRAKELDSTGIAGAAYSYLHQRQYDRAIEMYVKAKEGKPDRGNFQLAEAYIGKGMYQEAITEMQKVIARDKEPERWDSYPILAYAYAAAGKRDEALKILNEQNELAKKGYISPYNFAIIYTGLGDKDRAFEYLNKAYEEHAPVLQHFPSRPMFDPLHSDPRFADLVRRMNLPPERFMKT